MVCPSCKHEWEEAVCDCHTWPTVKELHDYCVAVEEKLKATQARAEFYQDRAAFYLAVFNETFPNPLNGKSKA